LKAVVELLPEQLGLVLEHVPLAAEGSSEGFEGGASLVRRLAHRLPQSRLVRSGLARTKGLILSCVSQPALGQVMTWSSWFRSIGCCSTNWQ
jgi:hypothetical protein